MLQYNKRVLAFLRHKSPDILILIMVAAAFLLGNKQISLTPRQLVLTPQQLSADQSWLALGSWQQSTRISGFYAVEQLADGAFYRWTNGHALIKLPNLGEPVALHIRLSSGTAKSVALLLRVSPWEATLAVSPGVRDYHILLPSGQTLRTGLRLDSEIFKPEGEGRRLGILVGSIRLVGEKIPTTVSILLALSAMGIYVSMRTHGQGRLKALLMLLFASVLSVLGYLLFSWYTPERTLVCGIMLLMLGWGTSTLFIKPQTDAQSRWLVFTATLLLAVMMILALLPIALAGGVSRYIADDYCYAVFAREHGIFGGLAYVYSTWSGRYSTILATAFLSQFGTIASPIYASALLPIWCLALFWLSSRIQLLTTIGPRSAIFLMGLAWLWLILASIPNVFQAFYWQNGSLTYSLPLVLMTAYAALLMRWAQASKKPEVHSRSWYLRKEIFLSAVLAFMISGFSETSTVLMVCLMFLAVIALYFFRVPGWLRRPTESGLLASLLGMIVIALSPGNRIRQAYIPQLPDPWTLTMKAFDQTNEIFWKPFMVLKNVFLRGPDAAANDLAIASASLLLLLLPLLFEWPHKPKAHIVALVAFPLTVMFGFSLSFATLLPTYLVTGLAPERVFMITQFVASGTILALGVLMGLLLQPLGQLRRALLPLMIMCAISLALLTPQIWPARIAKMQSYASFWPELDRGAQKAALQPGNGLELEVPFSDLNGIVLPFADPKEWQNICIADYYGLDWMSGKLP